MYKSDMNVKEETVRALLRYVLLNPNTSRAQIARGCGAGVTTVSRLLSFFCDKSLFVGGLRSEKIAAGVRPERFRLDPKYNFVVYSLSDLTVRAKLIDADGRILLSDGVTEGGIDPDIFGCFIESFEKKCGDIRPAHRFGTGVIFPDISPFGDREADVEAAKERLRGIVAPLSGAKRISVDAQSELAGIYFSAKAELRDRYALYFCINREGLFPSLVNAEVIGSDRGVWRDKLRIARERFVRRRDADSVAHAVARLCADAHRLFGVELIVLDSGDLSFVSGLEALVDEILRDKYGVTPEILSMPGGKPTVPECASAIVLKNMFAEDIVTKLFE